MTATDTSFFKSVDINGDDKVSRLEIIHFIDLIFVSTDADDFLQWDPGYLAVEEEAGRVANMNDAKLAIYDSVISMVMAAWSTRSSPFPASTTSKADVDHDRRLSQDELVNHYQIVRLVRLAIQ